jgi:hypothetical protein
MNHDVSRSDAVRDIKERWRHRSSRPEDFSCRPVLWRQADADYVARQIYGASPDAWRIVNHANPPDRDPAALPDRLHEWVRLVAPLLNRGVPQALLVGCKDYIEAKARQ